MIKPILIIFLSLFIFASCNNNMTKVIEDKKENDTNKQVKICIDDTKYIDITESEKNAFMFTKEDFANVVDGMYINNSSYLDIDSKNFTVHYFTQNCNYSKYKGKTLECNFTYDVKAAGCNCLYLTPSTRSGVFINVDGKTIKAIDESCFCLFLPMFGFGESRIEVNPILDGEIAMESGTYWKKGSKKV